MSLGEKFRSGSGGWWGGVACLWEMREWGRGGEGRRWGGVWGQAKVPASQCAHVCQYYPFANYFLAITVGTKIIADLEKCFQELP